MGISLNCCIGNTEVVLLLTGVHKRDFNFVYIYYALQYILKEMYWRTFSRHGRKYWYPTIFFGGCEGILILLKRKYFTFYF